MPLILTPRQLAKRSEFNRELAALLSAGVPVLQALRHIHRHPPTAAFRPHLDRVIEEIGGGATFTEALSAQGSWVPPFDLALIRAGEQSGRLAETCRALAGHYHDRAQLMAGFIAKLLYPIFLFHFAVLVFPPDLLPALIFDGEVWGFLRQKLLLLGPAYALVFMGALLLQSRGLTGWTAMVELLLRLLPGLGLARRELALARLASALESLISAGVGMAEAWELAADASGSPALRRAVRDWLPQVRAGDPPSEQLSRTREFPEFFQNLYATGEISGQLDQELRHLQVYYQDSGTRRLTRFALATGLLITLTIMGVIAFWVIQFWLGHYSGLFRDLGL
jgi:type II secretory pathway component PulF